MKKLLIISFDIIQENEPQTSLAIATLCSFLQKNKEFNDKYAYHHISINIKDKNKEQITSELFSEIQKSKITTFDFVAISTYVWSEPFVNETINVIKSKNPEVKIILGGSEISYSSDCELIKNFPNADSFIRGYAELSLLQLLTNSGLAKKFYDERFNLSDLNPLYSSNFIQLSQKKQKVRLETKRGCLFNCSFCAHKEKNSKKIEELNFENTIKELKFLNSKNIEKVNILDPVFNTGNYLEILEELVKMKFNPKISVQTRFELVHGKNGKRFLDLCEKLNITLEFGLQTIIEEEYKIIKRNNKKDKIIEVLAELEKRKIDYETSLIYGLPNQTVSSFKESIDFLRKNGNGKIVAFPLMLLKGTRLFHEKANWNLKEKQIGDFNLSYVVSSSSFTEKEYNEMEKIAQTL